MGMVRKSQLKRMGRRRFLKKMSLFGVSATSLPFLSQNSISEVVENPEDEVPYVAYRRHKNHEEATSQGIPDREPVWDTVSDKLWRVTQSAIGAGERLERDIASIMSNEPVTVGFSSDNNRYDKQVIVTKYERPKREGRQGTDLTISLQELEQSVPGKITGEAERNGKKTQRDFEVIVETKRVANGSGCYEYCTGNWGDQIPGGVKAEGSTLGTPATENSSGNNVMVSAGHINASNDKLAQPTDNDSFDDLHSIDHIDDVPNYIDWGYYAPSNVSLQWKLGADGGGTKTQDIVGIVTNKRLQNKEGDSDYKLKHQGKATGLSEGKVTMVSEGKWVETDCEGYAGDSGGPLFEKVSNPNYDVQEFYIASIFSQYVVGQGCDYNYTSGNTMEFIEQDAEITV